jgi:hypothetical protein
MKNFVLPESDRDSIISYLKTSIIPMREGVQLITLLSNLKEIEEPKEEASE